jgi:hypothetical protein
MVLDDDKAVAGKAAIARYLAEASRKIKTKRANIRHPAGSDSAVRRAGVSSG